MGTRQKSQLPIRDSRKHLQNTISESTINDKVPKDLKVLSSGKNRLKNQNNIAPHLRDPLTPLHRLRRFQEIRDRNLKKTSFGKARFNKNKMSVDVEKDDTSKGRRSVKEIKGTKDKISNGTQENGDKMDEISPKREDKNPPVEDNKEVNGSQEKGRTDEPQQIEIEKSQPTEAKKQNDSEKSKQIENDKKSPKTENEKNRTDKVLENEIEEKQIIVQENEIITKENNDINIDKIKENNKKVDIEDDEDEIEVLELDTEEEENRDTDYESFSNDEPQEKVKILRRSFRQELLRAKASSDIHEEAFIDTNASSSTSTNVSLSTLTNASSTTSTSASTSTKASASKQIENFMEKPKEKRLSISPETIRRIKAKRVEGRRSLWQSTGIHRKRKYDDYNEGCFDRYGKKPASNQTIDDGTPSVLSPGWKFISSPFTRFWTPRNSPPPGLTPYKSLTTPYPQNDIEDSLAVNVDDKSLYNKLNDSEFDISLNSTESTANTSSWRCNIM